MSFGDYGPRGQRIVLSAVIVAMSVPLLSSGPTAGGASLAAAGAASIGYQIGRVVEHDVMKEKKWYSEAE